MKDGNANLNEVSDNIDDDNQYDSEAMSLTVVTVPDGDEDDRLYEERLRQQHLSSLKGTQSKPVAVFLDEISGYEQRFVKNRLDSKVSILEFWKMHYFEFPVLYEVAMVVLGTPATQVSVERLFSQMKFILNDLRSTLSSGHVENIALVRNNFEHLDLAFFKKVLSGDKFFY